MIILLPAFLAATHGVHTGSWRNSLRKSHHKTAAGGPRTNEKVWVCDTGTCYRLRTESAVNSAGEKKKGREKEKKKKQGDYLCAS